MINLYTLWNAHIFTTFHQFTKSEILGHHISFLMKTREICDCDNFYFCTLFVSKLITGGPKLIFAQIERLRWCFKASLL